jgi:hypothetical protein
MKAIGNHVTPGRVGGDGVAAVCVRGVRVTSETFSIRFVDDVTISTFYR